MSLILQLPPNQDVDITRSFALAGLCGAITHAPYRLLILTDDVEDLSCPR